MNWSSAVTVMLNCKPTLALGGAVTPMCVAGPGFTVSVAKPVMEPLMVSVAVTV